MLGLMLVALAAVACAPASDEQSSASDEAAPLQREYDRRLLRAGQRLDMPESDLSLVVPEGWEAKTMSFEPLPAGSVADQMPFGAIRGIYVYPLDSGDPRYVKAYTGCPYTTWPGFQESPELEYVEPDEYLSARGIGRVMMEREPGGARSLTFTVDRTPGAMFIDLMLKPSQDGTTTAAEIRDALVDCGLDFPAQ